MNEVKTTFEERKGRLIVVNNIKWKWRIGKSNVTAYSENGIKLLSTPWDIKGISYATWERGQYKKTADGALMPAEVSNWIKEESKWKEEKK
jgi:hypothetical protein